MLSAGAIRAWFLVHKWTSLVATVVLLLLCLTGLPLIFYEEIDELTGRHPQAPTLSAAQPPASLDRLVEAALAARPGEVMQYLVFDDHGAPLAYLTTAPAPDAPPETGFTQVLDARTAAPIDAPPFDKGLMYVLYRLHLDLFAGLPGTLFLGAMGLLFVASIVSGIVLYGPFMRRLPFGTVRALRSPRVRWLDLHNLLGIVTLAWALVVGLTGVINTLAQPIRDLWRLDQLAEMVAPYQDAPPVARLASVESAVATARAAAPEMVPSFVAWPGTPFTSAHHYAVFLRGATPLTSQLFKPALIDAETGELTDLRTMPWYVTALLVSRPLHFGDYGGLPLKLIWALLDIVTIVVLASGLYLWLTRGRAWPAELASDLALAERTGR
jgi:uncharacterized iron-regulated membrane protein